MLVKDFLKTVYFKVKQSWASAAIWGDWLPIIDESLSQLFMYNWYRRSRQHTIEEIPATQFKHWNMFQINTTFPVLDVYKFFDIPEDKCTEWVEFCEPLWEMKTWIDKCSAGIIWVSWITSINQCWRISIYYDWEIEMEHRKPKSTLWWWTFSMLDWVRSTVIRWMLPTSLKKDNRVYMVYYRWFNKLTSMNDDIQIPDFLAPALSHLVVSKIIDTWWQFRSWDWTYHYSMFETIMKNAREAQPQTATVLKMQAY